MWYNEVYLPPLAGLLERYRITPPFELHESQKGAYILIVPEADFGLIFRRSSFLLLLDFWEICFGDFVSVVFCQDGIFRRRKNFVRVGQEYVVRIDVTVHPNYSQMNVFNNHPQTNRRSS
ncbi:MAG: hypothetical protein LBQ66_13720 [Planctomycetaceae bacterium]|nr:hypothetical protein [Planctomycetaceae bacterium]